MTANVTKVTVSSDSPNGQGEWAVDLTGMSMAQQLVYNNAAYLLVGRAMSALGIEYSKLILEGDNGKFNAKIAQMSAALTVEMPEV